MASVARASVEPLATTYQIFEIAERIELVSAAGYALLAERFRGDLHSRAVFLRLEEEELQHAARVRLLAARYRHDPRLLDGAPANPSELTLMLEDAEAALASIRAGTFADTAEEAMVNLVALEERCGRAHAELIAQDGHPALRDFFVQLSTQDDGHRELLLGLVGK
jgi:rubrerythrin